MNGSWADPPVGFVYARRVSLHTVRVMQPHRHEWRFLPFALCSSVGPRHGLRVRPPADSYLVTESKCCRERARVSGGQRCTFLFVRPPQEWNLVRTWNRSPDMHVCSRYRCCHSFSSVVTPVYTIAVCESSSNSSSHFFKLPLLWGCFGFECKIKSDVLQSKINNNKLNL